MSKTSFEKAKDYIIKAGFSHIKLEMEADMGREEETYDCDECYGEGYVECHECTGSGVVYAERPNGTTIEVECDECGGEGRIECEYCHGTGECGGCGSWNTDECESWILDNLSQGAREAITYSQFYYDGSVDSEMTLTIPVSKAEYMIEYLEAFKALGDGIGNGLSTGGAGLHIALIPASSNGYYPATTDSLDIDGWNNFKKQMTKLLPAMFMLASSNKISRALEYRYPRVSCEEKYSAIYARERACIEYRIFETCYDKPEAIIEYIEVIAKTLRFYVNKHLEAPTLNTHFRLIDSYNNNKVSRFYNSPENIKILRQQLKILKPDNKSISYLMKSREVPTITELRKQISNRRAELKKEWYERKRKIDIILSTPKDEYEQSVYNEWVTGVARNGEPVSPRLAEYYARNIEPLNSLTSYIRDNIQPHDRCDILLEV